MENSSWRLSVYWRKSCSCSKTKQSNNLRCIGSTLDLMKLHGKWWIRCGRRVLHMETKNPCYMVKGRGQKNLFFLQVCYNVHEQKHYQGGCTSLGHYQHLKSIKPKNSSSSKGIKIIQKVYRWLDQGFSRDTFHYEDPFKHVLHVIGGLVTCIICSFIMSLMDILVLRLKLGPKIMQMKDLNKKGALQDEHPT